MKPPWLVLGPRDGEALRLRPPSRSGNVTIKVDRRRVGSPLFAVGHQRLGPGASIPVHLHEHQDEVIFVHAGRGTAVFDGRRVPVRTRSTIFVRRGVWHGVDNTSRADLHLVWIISPPGLEDMFRDISVRKGGRPERMTREEFAALVRRHRMRVRPAAARPRQAGAAPGARRPAASRAAHRRPRRHTLRSRRRSSARTG
ncbi:MAG TPA: cupin domain-containing protein [bacterium]|nr:cupin domain-containing protein [bacterium]